MLSGPTIRRGGEVSLSSGFLGRVKGLNSTALRMRGLALGERREPGMSSGVLLPLRHSCYNAYYLLSSLKPMALFQQQKRVKSQEVSILSSALLRYHVTL